LITEDFLNNLWEKRIEPQKTGKTTLETWIIDELFYPDYKKFENIFTNYDETSKQLGNAYLYHKDNMNYPKDIDATLSLQKFITDSVQENLPICIKEFRKAWGVKYGQNSYSGFHCHTMTANCPTDTVNDRQLTAVLFLNSVSTSIEYPMAGNLITLQPLPDYQVNFQTHTPKAGEVVIMDGRVWHGTYPTIDERRVFVCDFLYEVENSQ